MRQPCSDGFIWSFSRKLKDWRELHLLGDDGIDETNIDRDFKLEEEKKRQYLQIWKQRYGKEATYKRLALSLLKAERLGLAGEVCTEAAEGKLFLETTITSSIVSIFSCKGCCSSAFDGGQH